MSKPHDTANTLRLVVTAIFGGVALMLLILIMSYSPYGSNGGAIKRSSEECSWDGCTNDEQWNVYHSSFWNIPYLPNINYSTGRNTFDTYQNRTVKGDKYYEGTISNSTITVQEKQDSYNVREKTGTTSLTEITGNYCDTHQMVGARLVNAANVHNYWSGTIVTVTLIFATLLFAGGVAAFILLGNTYERAKAKKLVIILFAISITLPLVILKGIVPLAHAVNVRSLTADGDAKTAAENHTKQEAYEAAEQLLSTADYDGAAAAFEALGYYSDAAERVLDARYQQAEALLSERKLDEAVKAFTALGAYRDARDSVPEMCYQLGTELEADGAYNEAYAAFAKADKYKDAQDLARQLLYTLNGGKLATLEGAYFYTPKHKNVSFQIEDGHLIRYTIGYNNHLHIDKSFELGYDLDNDRYTIGDVAAFIIESDNAFSVTAISTIHYGVGIRELVYTRTPVEIVANGLIRMPLK